VTRHATTSRHDERTRGRCNQIGRQRRAARNKQLARREDEKAAQQDGSTDATRHATTGRRDERRRGQRKTMGRQRRHTTTSWRSATRGKEMRVPMATLSTTRITPTWTRTRRTTGRRASSAAAEGCSHRRRRHVSSRRDAGQVFSLRRYLDQQHRRRACPEFVADRAMVLML